MLAIILSFLEIFVVSVDTTSVYVATLTILHVLFSKNNYAKNDVIQPFKRVIRRIIRNLVEAVIFKVLFLLAFSFVIGAVFGRIPYIQAYIRLYGQKIYYLKK